MPQNARSPSKPDGCRGCPLERAGKGFCLDAHVADPDYLLIGEAPGRQEIARGEPFVGDAGWVLKEWGMRGVPALQQAWERGRVSRGNVLRCLPPKVQGRAYPTGETRRQAEAHCRVHDTPSTAPVVILCGEAAQRLHFGKELAEEDAKDRARGAKVKGVLRRIGRHITRGDHRYLFAPHPAWVLREPSLYEHLTISLSIAADAAEEVRPCFVPWWEATLALDQQAEVGLDLEWDHTGRITVYGFSWDGGRYATATYVTPETTEWVRERVRAGWNVVAHNGLGAGSDRDSLLRAGFDLSRVQWFDTHLGLYATHTHLAGIARGDTGEDKGAIGSFDARSLALLYGARSGQRLPLDWKRYAEDLLGTCADDAACALWCTTPLRRRIARLGVDATVDVLHAAAPIFAAMTAQGIRLDRAVLERIHQERVTRVADLVARHGLTETRGKRVLKTVPIWRSPKVLDRYEALTGVRPPDRTAETWARLAQEGPPAGRELAQALILLSEGANDAHWLGAPEDTEAGTTFEKVSADGFVYPRWRLTATQDRSVARGPNMKNFPRVQDDPRTTPLRSAVIPLQPDHVLLSADFDSLETYTTAIVAGDWNRVRAIQDGRVSHEATAALAAQVTGHTFTRQQGKTINHALDKGMSAFELARHLFGSATREHVRGADRIMSRILAEWPVTARFRKTLWDACRQNPYEARNAFGRRLLIFGRARFGEEGGGSRGDTLIRERWKRALAFLSRSAGYDVLLRVLVRIMQESRLGEWSLPYIEVSDELDFSVPALRAEELARELRRAFEEPVSELGGFRFPCAVKIGRTWAECK